MPVRIGTHYLYSFQGHETSIIDNVVSPIHYVGVPPLTIGKVSGDHYGSYRTQEIVLDLLDAP
jgi:hypothetical protein